MNSQDNHKLDESTGLWGRVKVIKRYPTWDEIAFEDDNLIVINGRRLFINQLYYTVGNGNPITFAKFGTGGALDSEGVFLKTPTPDMTDLYTPAFDAPVVKVSENLAIPSITLTGSLDNSTANGTYFNEAGFFAANGTMFNIKTFPRVLKTVNFSLNVTWEIGLK